MIRGYPNFRTHPYWTLGSYLGIWVGHQKRTIGMIGTEYPHKTSSDSSNLQNLVMSVTKLM